MYGWYVGIFDGSLVKPTVLAGGAQLGSKMSFGERDVLYSVQCTLDKLAHIRLTFTSAL